MAGGEFTARKRGCSYVHVNRWYDDDVARAFCRAAEYEPLVVGFEKPLPRKTDAKRRRAEGRAAGHASPQTNPRRSRTI